MSSFVSTPVSRRALLAGASGLSLAGMLALAGCSSSGSQDDGAGEGADFTGALTFLLPGTAPTGWDAVLKATNDKLKTDLGFTIEPQFISWADYPTQSLLRFTSGARFDTALQARWLNMTKLVSDKALLELSSLVPGHENLVKTIDPTILKSNTWSTGLYGIPQVNSAARLHHFTIRQDLAEAVGASEISDFEALEKFFYDVKQRYPDVIPMGYNTGSGANTVFGPVTPTLNAWAWDNPTVTGWNFTGDSLFFAFAADAATTGSSDPVPFWEQEGVADALQRVRKYNQDGIINGDILNLDTSAEQSLFTSGRTAGRWAITDGTSSNPLVALLKAVPNAALANVAPLTGGLTSKPYQTFQADNFTVFNARGESSTAAMALQDWVSVKEHSDLLSYGIEGTDWKAAGDDGVELLSDYSFPAYALNWRVSTFRAPSTMSETEKAIFDWSKETSNFTTDPFASFIPDVTPVENQNAQVAAAVKQYAKPLFAGVVDVQKGLDDLKRAVDAAGLDQLQTELAKQADAYLAAR